MTDKQEKATFSKMQNMKKKLEEKPKEKTVSKAKTKSTPKKKEKAPLEAHVPRGQRKNFLRITLTIPGNLLTKLRLLGSKRKAAKGHDTDTSSLIRESLVDFLNKHKDILEDDS